MFHDILSVFGEMPKHIPAGFFGADYLIGLLWACLIGASILVWPVSRTDRRHLLILWAVKCVVALGFMVLIEMRYNNDSFWYFERSLKPNSPWAWKGFTTASGTMVTCTLSPGTTASIFLASYHAMKVSFAAVGLVAIYLFYRAAVVVAGFEDRRLLYVLALYPSLLFWSSLLGKDPLVLLGIALYTFGVVRWARLGSNWNLAIVLAGVLIVLSIRFWLIAVLAGAFAVLALRTVRGPFRKAAVVAGVGAAVGWTVVAVANALRIREAQHVFRAIGNLAAEHSATALTFEITSLEGLLLFLPAGMFTALFRPLPAEVPNAFGLLAGIENACLLALVLFTAWRTRLSAFRDPLVQWATAFILPVEPSVRLLSTLNLGVAARMKIQVLPMLLGLLLYLGTRHRRSRSVQAPGADAVASIPHPASQDECAASSGVAARAYNTLQHNTMRQHRPCPHAVHGLCSSLGPARLPAGRNRSKEQFK
jgi:hypothetical protein